MKRYEQSIRVLTAFFAVLLGFGLKKLLDEGSDEIHAHRAPFFVLSASLFLRLLLGSANHSWHDYVLPDSKETVPFRLHPTELIRDLLFLVVHGFLGIAICYSTKVDDFFGLHLWFTGIAFAWVVIYVPHGWLLGRKVGKWIFWAVINLLQGTAILAAWLWARPQNWGKVPWPEEWFGEQWDWYLLMLVVAYAVFLVADVWCQLSVLKNAVAPQTAAPQGEQEDGDAKQEVRDLREEIGELKKAIESQTSQLKGLREKWDKLEPGPGKAEEAKGNEQGSAQTSLSPANKVLQQTAHAKGGASSQDVKPA